MSTVPNKNWKIHFCDGGNIRGTAGRRIEVFAERLSDGAWLRVADFKGYHKKFEDGHLVLYPERIHRAGYMEIKKMDLPLSEIEKKPRA